MTGSVVDLIERKVRPMREEDKVKVQVKLPVDPRGRVRVWQIESKRWVNLHAIDAREQLGRGIVSLEEGTRPPEVLPAAHLPEMTVREIEQYVADNGLDVDLSQHRLKDEKVEAVRKAIAEAQE